MAPGDAIPFLAQLDRVLGDASDAAVLAYVKDQRRRSRDGDDSIFDALEVSHICLEHEIAAQAEQEQRLLAALAADAGPADREPK